jgi:VIT1/CCC1 family predicted Fe2+/Mn2+ transporter
LLLVWILAALLTWSVGRLMGGQGRLVVQAHVVAVAISAWALAGGLIAALVVLVPYFGARIGPLQLPFPRIFDFVGVVLGVAGFVWLAQATRTAQRISAVRAITAAVLAAALGALILVALHRLTHGAFTNFLSKPVIVFFLPWLG